MSARSIAISSFVVWSLLWPTNAFACLVKDRPDHNQLNEYESIYLVTIEKVEVLSDPGWDLTRPHNIEASVVEVLKGRKRESLSLKAVTGCGVAIPDFGESGLLFFRGDMSMIPTYQSEHKIFDHYVEEFRFALNDRN